MSTVSKEIADRIIKGAWPEDDATCIVEYDNKWGGVGYGVTFGKRPNVYLEPSEFVRNPRIYWQRSKGDE